MDRPYTVRGVAVIAWPALAVAVLLLLAPWWSNGLPAAPLPPLWVLLLLAVAGAAAGSYLPFGSGSLGLGAAALPPALLQLGPLAGGLFAVVVLVLREMVRRLLLPGELPHLERTTLVRLAGTAGRLAAAGIGAGLAAVLVARLASAPVFVHLASACAYLGILGGLTASAAVWGPPPRRPLRLLLPRLTLDAAGWLLGASVATAASAGWIAGLLPLAGVAALAAELARNAHRRRLAVTRIRDLHEVSLAGQRIGDGTADLTSMAGQVFAECRRVLPFGWSQFELLEEGERRSWRAEERGGIEEGEPEPPASPPSLPGVHRRTGWRILVRELSDDGQLIARLRFWCDPRRLEPTSVELLDALLPQITSSLRQALVERQAKRDPLTNLPDRRVLEARLEDAYRRSRGEGSSMAVIMCDIDRFKRINDTYGHAAGDGALLKVAEVLESCRRDSDLCARYGGEEFAVVLERGDGETALTVAERIRQAVGMTVYVHEGQRLRLRVSAGVASYPALHVESGKELLLLADEALYEAKRRGRDRCLLHLGRRRFQQPDGAVLGDEKPPPDPEVPTLFA